MRNSRSKKITAWIAVVLFAIYAISLIFPFVWLFLSSLKQNDEFFMNNPFSFPRSWLFSNYIEAFDGLNVNGNGMFAMFFNSLWFSIGAAILNVLFSAMTGYCAAKYRFLGRRLLYIVSLIIMVIPIVGSLPAQYRLFSVYGILNTPFILLSFIGGFGFGFVVFYGFFQGIPRDYSEAAFIDGAGHHRVFWTIILPQAMPMLFALGIIQMISFWNDYSYPLVFIEDYPTLSSGLYEYQIDMTYKSNYPLFFAGVLLSMVPVLVLFGVFQNTIMENTYAGGLKG